MNQVYLIIPYLLIGLLLVALGIFAAGAGLNTAVAAVLVPVLFLLGALLPLAATYDYMQQRTRRPTAAETRRATMEALQAHSDETNRSLGLPVFGSKK